VLAVVRSLGLEPLPYLLAIALGSNVGSAMTPTGNPQNMLIGVASGIPFARFVGTLALPSLGGLAIVFGVIAFVHRRTLAAAPRRLTTTAPAAAEHPFDAALVTKALVIFGGALAGWLAGLSLPLIAISAAAFAMLGAAGAHAEAYEGVHAITSSASRMDVQAEAVAATRAGNSYSDSAAEGTVAVNSTLDRNAVRDQAVATAHDPLQSLDRRAFYRDQVPSAYSKPTVSFTRQAGL